MATVNTQFNCTATLVPKDDVVVPAQAGTQIRY